MVVRVIFVSWSFVPRTEPRARQVERLLWNAPDCEIHVFTCAPQGHRDAGADVGNRYFVHNVPERWVDRLLGVALRVFGAAIPVTDGQVLWSRRATELIRRTLKISNDDVLVTFGSPMSDHLVGLRLRKEVGVWLAHFSDPWSANPYRRLLWPLRSVSRSVERSVVRAADSLIFTTDETIRLAEGLFGPEIRAKSYECPHSFPAFRDTSSSSNARSTVVIRYVGSLYGRRTPAPVVGAMRSLRRRHPEFARLLQVELVGSISLRHKLLLKSRARGLNIFSVGPVPLLKAEELEGSADVLLSIDANSTLSPFFPSKLVEYFSWSKPVIAITPEGSAARICRAVGASIVDPRDRNGLVALLIQAVEGRVVPPDSAGTSAYLTERVSPRFWSHVTLLSDQKRSRIAALDS